MADETNITGNISGDNVNVGGIQIITFSGRHIEYAPPPHPKSVFLSYARADDTPFVRRLYDHLTEQGFDVWFDEQKMPNRGLTFLQEIRDAIDAVDTLLLVVGPGAALSDYVRAEWDYALRTCTRVVPVARLDDDETDVYKLIPPELANFHAEDCRPNRDEAAALTRIAQIIADDPAPLATLRSRGRAGGPSPSSRIRTRARRR